MQYLYRKKKYNKSAIYSDFGEIVVSEDLISSLEAKVAYKLQKEEQSTISDDVMPYKNVKLKFELDLTKGRRKHRSHSILVSENPFMCLKKNVPLNLVHLKFHKEKRGIGKWLSSLLKFTTTVNIKRDSINSELGTISEMIESSYLNEYFIIGSL